MRVIRCIWSIMQNTSSGLRYVNCIPSQMQCICTAISNFQGQKSNRTYLRCYWGYAGNSIRVIRRIWSLIHSTSSDLRYNNRLPCQVQYIGCAFSNFQSQKSNRTYLRCYWCYVDNLMRVIRRIWSLIQSTASGLCYVNCGTSQMQRNYSLLFLRPKI
jgi:hypothetical protein